jgi:acyl carrier protein
MELNEIKNKIRGYLSRSVQDYEIKDDDNIFELGIVHSLFAIQIIIFIEKNFDIELDDDELDMEKMKSINSIAELIQSNLKKD